MGLVRVQPAKPQKQGRVCRGVMEGAVRRRTGPGRGEVGDVERLFRRPALGQDEIDDIGRIADQKVVPAKIFQVVIAAQPPDPRPGSLGRRVRRPAHPAEDRLRLLLAGEPSGDQPGRPLQSREKGGVLQGNAERT